VHRQTWLAVQGILRAPERRTTRSGRAVHLLSMIARCDVCDAPLVVGRNGRKTKPGQLWYRCQRAGHVQVDKSELEELAEQVIARYLSRPDNVERLTRDDSRDEELTAVRQHVAEVRAELDDLADRLGRGELSAALTARAEPAIVARLRAAEEREEFLSTPSVLRGLTTPGKDVGRRWKAAPLSAKREAARLPLSPGVLGELRVTRKAEPSRRTPVIERVSWKQR
jgi:site-specific DNA recombinase